MEKIGFVYTTFATHEDAVEAVRKLVHSGDAACGNIMPAHTAIYRWNNEIQQESEIVVILKCAIDGVDNLVAKIKEMHPYDIPCIVQLDAKAIPEYAQWLLT